MTREEVPHLVVGYAEKIPGMHPDERISAFLSNCDFSSTGQVCHHLKPQLSADLVDSTYTAGQIE